MAKTSREAVRALCIAGKKTSEIAIALGISEPSVAYHKGRLRTELGEDYFTWSQTTSRHKDVDWVETQRQIGLGLTHKEICEVMNISKQTLTNAYKRGMVIRLKLKQEMTLLEYLADWGNREAESHFRRMVKKKMVAEGYCTLSCAECGLTEWRGRPAPLELDHIDGDPTNNNIVNLRILCLHCHTQTPTFGWRNVHGKRKLKCSTQ